MWSDNGVDAKKIAPAQKSTLQALEQIQNIPSPLVVSALSQPIFDACSILATKGNADSRGVIDDRRQLGQQQERRPRHAGKDVVGQYHEGCAERRPTAREAGEDRARNLVHGGKERSGEPQEEGQGDPEGDPEETRDAHRRGGGRVMTM